MSKDKKVNEGHQPKQGTDQQKGYRPSGNTQPGNPPSGGSNIQKPTGGGGSGKKK